MTDLQLMEYSADHLHYDLWMLGETAWWLAHDPAAREPFSVIKSAVLESFTVHVRSIAGFLYYPKSKPDDVTAEDYVGDVIAWRTARGQMPDELDIAVVRTNKEIVHLTTKRRRRRGPPRRSIEHLLSR